MLLTMRLLDWESSTLTIRPLRLTPSFSKCWIKKENNTVCSSINSPTNLVNNVFASVHYLGFNIKSLNSFSPKILGVSLTLCQKEVNTAEGIFLPGGENLR